MGKIAKIKWNNINGGTDRTDLYPITSDRAVYNGDNKTMRELIKVRGVVNISTYFTPDGTPEVLTLSQAVAKITYENRCPGFLATILTSEGWFTFRYSANEIDDTTWSNTDNWIVFHAGRLTVEATSPLHLLLSLKNYVYTLRGYIDAVSESQDGYMTKEDYQKFLQALEDIKNLLSRMTSVEGRLDSAEGRLDSAEGRLDSAEGRLDDAESRLNEADNKFTQINNEISNINVAIASLEENLKNLKIATVVEVLPAENINENTMYLVPDQNAEEGNKFIEYIYVDNAWEKVGEVQLGVNLSEYTKTSELDTLLTSWGYIKSSDLSECVTSIQAVNTSTLDIANCLTIAPQSKSTGDIVINIGIASANLKAWIEENVDLSNYQSLLHHYSEHYTGENNTSDYARVYINYNNIYGVFESVVSSNLASGSNIYFTTDYIGTAGSLPEIYSRDDNADTKPRAVLAVHPDFIKFTVDQLSGSEYSNELVFDRNALYVGGTQVPVPQISANQANPSADIYFYNSQLITGTISSDTTYNFHQTGGTKGAQVQIILQATKDVTVTLTGTYTKVTDGYTNFTVSSNKYVEINAVYDGNYIYVRSSYMES